MTNKIYTDEEIVKALECCLCDNSECLQCQNRELCKMERDELATKTIDLIIRKTEEINRLKAEIERLKGSTIVNNIMESQRIKKEAKSEAVKEFAERLKEKSFQSFGNYGITRDVVEVCDIDNLIKEMVDEDNVSAL